MINVVQLDDVTFNIRFDEQTAKRLAEFSGWIKTELTLRRILTDALWNSPSDYYDDLDGDVPF